MGQAGLTAPDGTPTGAVYGFLRVVAKLLKDHRPTHFAVLWDTKDKTFRHDLYPAYKANRSEPPPEIIPQIGLIQEILPKLGVPCFRKPGFEADDLIGTLAQQCKEWANVFIVSADKDFMQLVDDRVKMFSLKKGDEYVVIDEHYVEDYFGVKPDKVRDVLSIMGDKVDNVPGVKGIGEKGAAKLIQEFGCIEAVYEKIDLIQAKKQKELLLAHKEDALISKHLVEINCRVPIDVVEQELVYTYDKLCLSPNLKTCLNDLQMHSLLRSLLGDAAGFEKIHTASETIRPATLGAANVKETAFVDRLFADDAESELAGVAATDSERALEVSQKTLLELWGKRTYTCVNTWAALERLLAQLVAPQTVVCAFDTETTGLDFMEDVPIGFSLCFEPGHAYYVPACEEHFADSSVLDRIDNPARLWQLLGQAFERRSCMLLAHNAKFDLHMLLGVGVSVGAAPVACSMVASWLIDAQAGGYGLDAQSLKVLGLEKIPTSQLIGAKAGRSGMREVPIAEITEYACEDVDATLRLWKNLEPRLRELKLHALFWELEMPLLRVLVQMERAGVHIDSSVLADLTVEIQERLAQLEQDIFELSGEVFKISSPKQLGAVLFEKLKVHEQMGFKGKLARTTLGYKTDSSVLEKFHDHPVVQKIQEYRELAKLLSTYVMVLPQLIKETTGRIHTHFHQIGTATGRLSSSDPNLQNIPVRTPLGKRVRKAFCAPSKDFCMMSVDYSQIELRVLAELANDPTMIQAFAGGADIHRETAAKISGKNPEDVLPEERSAAKAINFGIIYGMGPQRLAREQNVSIAEAKVFIEKYFLNFSRIQNFIESSREFAHRNGCVMTDFGRIRPLPQLQSKNLGEVRQAENMAVNSPIQGTAADIMKLGMLKVHEALKKAGLKTRMVLQVHDELVFECPVAEVEQVRKLVQHALQTVVQYKVPLTVEVGVGENWLEAK